MKDPDWSSLFVVVEPGVRPETLHFVLVDLFIVKDDIDVVLLAPRQKCFELLESLFGITIGTEEKANEGWFVGEAQFFNFIEQFVLIDKLDKFR